MAERYAQFDIKLTFWFHESYYKYKQKHSVTQGNRKFHCVRFYSLLQHNQLSTINLTCHPERSKGSKTRQKGKRAKRCFGWFNMTRGQMEWWIFLSSRA